MRFHRVLAHIADDRILRSDSLTINRIICDFSLSIHSFLDAYWATLQSFLKVSSLGCPSVKVQILPPASGVASFHCSHLTASHHLQSLSKLRCGCAASMGKTYPKVCVSFCNYLMLFVLQYVVSNSMPAPSKPKKSRAAATTVGLFSTVKIAEPGHWPDK